MKKTVRLVDPLSEFSCQHQMLPTSSNAVAADPQNPMLSILLSRECSWRRQSAGGSTMRNRATSMRTMWRNRETSSTRGPGRRWISGGSITMMDSTHDTPTTAHITEHAPSVHDMCITLKCNIFTGSDAHFPQNILYF